MEGEALIRKRDCQCGSLKFRSEMCLNKMLKVKAHCAGKGGRMYSRQMVQTKLRDLTLVIT